LGAILAGGQSARMGRTKAGIEVDGETLAARAAAALAPLVDEVVVLGHGDGCPAELRRLPDRVDGEGPLAGMAALADEGAARVLVVSCDMPRISTAALRPLLAERGSAAWAGRTLPAVFTGDDLVTLRARFDAGQRRLRLVVDELCAARPRAPLTITPHLDDADAPDDLDVRARRSRVVRWRRGGRDAHDDVLAAEEPLELRVGGVPIAVVMRTPGHDEELGTGFLLTEAIVDEPGDVSRVAHCTEVEDEDALDNVLQITLAPGKGVDVARLRRNLFASSSCGVCGKATIEQALRSRGPVDDDARVSLDTLLALPERMREAQDVFHATGGLHAAALFDREGELLCLREDVGRHNAVDKVIGWAAREARSLTGTVLQVSGRASFEIVQKAANARVPIVTAVSAPTSLAVDAAEALGVTLLGFARPGRLNAYAHAERVVD
jgi:FdhD protein